MKAHVLPALASRIAPLVGPRTIIVAAMNGLPWWFFDGFGGPLDGAALGNRRAINLPGLSVTVDDMIDALREVAGIEAVKLIRRAEDERVVKIVGSWPGRWDTSRAEALGLAGDASFVDVIRGYLEDERR